MRSARSAQDGRNTPSRVRAVSTRSRAFSLTDVLVSIAVIAVLISLLLPSLGPVKETARQVACRSGVRQLGLGIAMFADDHQDWIPNSKWHRSNPSQPAQTVCLTYGGKNGFEWDGLGILYHEQYIVSPGSFYCPSHRAEHRYSDQVELWQNPVGVIVGNYQYRAGGPNPKATTLSEIEPKRSALLSDSLRTQEEYNHSVGANVLRADLSVYWFNDHQQSVTSYLGKDDGTGAAFTSPSSLGHIWQSFDEGR
jgi:type II secretory pathway pseudopilin PulG